MVSAEKRLFLGWISVRFGSVWKSEKGSADEFKNLVWRSVFWILVSLHGWQPVGLKITMRRHSAIFFLSNAAKDWVLQDDGLGWPDECC
jgi:hypothetical protein